MIVRAFRWKEGSQRGFVWVDYEAIQRKSWEISSGIDKEKIVVCFGNLRQLGGFVGSRQEVTKNTLMVHK